MTIEEHIEKRLKNSADYELTDQDKKIIKFEKIETFIYRKLTSTKFRKTSIDADSEKQVKNAISLNVKANQPIKFTYPFGAYKIWRVPTYPNVDWAEFMAISYLIKYLAAISKSYEPGVELYFSSDDVVIEFIDNYTRESLNAYNKSFKNLLGYFAKYTPKNLKIELKQVVPDYYSKEEYQAELTTLYNAMKSEGLPQQRKDKLKLGFDFNCNRKGNLDLTNDTKYLEVLDDLFYWNEAYMKLTKRRAFVRGEDKIVLFSNKIPNAIDIGSTNVSKAKFWAGIGTFEESEGRYFDRIMSPKQWDDNKSDVEMVPSTTINMPNFDSIPIFHKRFDFLQRKSQ